jgi:Protein of unknown function (DUF2911)/Protein of unknown function (DUF3347)
MKKLLIINVLCLFALTIQAQEQLNRKAPKSPEAAFTQQFGDSEIQVAYARPLTRGRKIFGALVPFDSLWRTGASDCTTLKLKEDVVIGDKKMGAGKYALFTIPTADEWTIILNSDTTLHGSFGYDAKKDVSRFKIKPIKTDRFYETFTIEINDINAKGEGFLNLIWENTIVPIPLNPSTQLAEKTASVAPQTPIVQAENKPNTEGGMKTETMPKMDSHAGHDMSKMDKNTEGGKKVETQAKANTPAGHDMSKMGANTEGGKTVDIKAQFAPVLSAYYGLKDALVADNSKLAAEKGKAMKTALGNIDTKNWTPKQRVAYDAVAKKMETDAEHIGDNAGKIDHQREHLITLSNNLSSIVKSLKINEEAAYLQFCPMANDGKGGYWLSKENKVKNPYYGKSMLTCGSVKETLK